MFNTVKFTDMTACNAENDAAAAVVQLVVVVVLHRRRSLATNGDSWCSRICSSCLLSTACLLLQASAVALQFILYIRIYATSFEDSHGIFRYN